MTAPPIAYDGPPITRAHAAADRRLHDAIRQALDARDWIPCAGVDSWTSNDPAERDHAAAFCADCPPRVFAACAAVGEHETAGVWAGLDRASRRKGRAA